VQVKAAMDVMIKGAIKIRPIEMNYAQAIKYFDSRCAPIPPTQLAFWSTLSSCCNKLQQAIAHQFPAELVRMPATAGSLLLPSS
jgi:hypothetical protein